MGGTGTGVPVAEGSVVIGTDLSGVDKGLAVLRGKLTGFASGIAGALKSIVMAPSNLAASLAIPAKQIAIGLGVITGAFAFAGRSAVEAASSFNETMSKFNVVFGAQADATYEWAEQFASAANRGRGEIVALLATTQDFFVPMGLARDKAAEMSKVLVKLAVDIGSFANLSTEEAFTKLISGVAGETEAVRRLGIDISDATLKHYALSQGITQSWESVSFATKAILRLNKMMQDSTDAQGDAIRTADQWANAIRGLGGHLEDLKEAIGSQLIPILGPYLTKITDIVKATTAWIRENPAFVEGMFQIARAVAVVAGLAAGLATVLTSLVFVASPLGALFSGIAAIAADMGWLHVELDGIRESMSQFVEPVKAVGAAVVAKLKVEVSRLFLYVLDKVTAIGDWLERIITSLRPRLAGMTEQFGDMAVTAIAAVLPRLANLVGEALLKLATLAAELGNNVVVGLAMTLFKQLKRIPGLRDMMPTEDQMRGMLTAASDVLSEFQREQGVALTELNRRMNEAISNLAAQDLAQMFDNTGIADAIGDPLQALRDFGDGIRRSLGADTIAANAGLQEALGGLQGVLDGLGRSIGAPGETLSKIPTSWGAGGEAGKKGGADTFGIWGSQNLRELMGFAQRDPAKDQLREQQRTNALLTDILSATESQGGLTARYA